MLKQTQDQSPVPSDRSLVAWMDQQVETLRTEVKRAVVSFDADAIHDARVATRRLRAALNWVEPHVDDVKRFRQFRRSLQRIRRALGPLRDLDVMIGHLDQHWARDSHAPAARWAQDRLVDERARRHEEFSHKKRFGQYLAQLGAWRGLMERVQKIEPAVMESLSRRLGDQLAEFATRADALARFTPDAAGPVPDPHALRIAGKLLRYTLEIARATVLDVPVTMLGRFKRMQEELGLWHDYAVLSQQVMRLSLDAELAYHNRSRFGPVLKLAQVCWNRAEQRLTRFITLWKQSGSDLRLDAAGLAGPAPCGTPTESGKIPLPPASKADRAPSSIDDQETS